MNAPKYDGMNAEKRQVVTRGDQGTSVVHYVKDLNTGKMYDFKFKQHSKRQFYNRYNNLSANPYSKKK